MSPAEITALINSLASLFSVIGAAPIMAICFGILLGPWAVLVIISVFQHRRFEAVVTMYNNNFAQVEGIKDLAGNYKDMAKDDRETVVWAAAEVQALRSAIEGNMHCPLIRKNAKPKDINDEQ